VLTHFLSRGIAALVTGLLVVGSVSATAPAFADETTPAPVAQTTAPFPAASGNTVTLNGSVVEIADDETGAVSDVKLFHVKGHGYLPVDFSEATLDASGSATIDLTLPDSVDVGTTLDEKFAALAEYTTEHGALVASNSAFMAENTINRGVAEMVNQTPSVSAVHKIFAVLVTPSNVAGSAAHADQTAAKVQEAVTHSSTYWSAQSDTKVSFALQGTVPWYKSAYSCETSTTSYQMWSEAAAVATSQLGYVDAPNSHLVLFFPPTITNECGNAIGLATVGASTNTGGVVWVSGTNSAIAKSTLSHELGHNLTYGHANWLDCDTATPQPGAAGTTGCAVKNYGDTFDVMGFGISGYTGGSLSSAHAIRSGLWPSTAFANATSNTTQSYTLNAISSNSGLRSVVVEDNLGVNYFVEFRNYTGKDAQYQALSTQCTTQICMPAQPGVRILRLAPNANGLKGGNGDDQYLIGRIVGGVKRVNYTAGESFSTGGISITVSSLTATTATVSIVKPAGVVVADPAAGSGITLASTLTYLNDGYQYPGDSMTIRLSNAWRADSYAYQWYLNDGLGSGRVAIPGATAPTYTFQNSDVGKAWSFSVTGQGTSPVTVSVPDAQYSGYSAVRGKTMTPGTVTVSNATNALTAVTAGWDSGTTFTYSWLRGSTEVGNGVSYTPTQADRGSTLAVVVTASKAGYTSRVAYSTAKNYTITASGALSITGAATVGQVLGVTESLTYSTVDGTPTINSRTYQWLRDGVAISGATSATYTIVTADIDKAITVTMMAGATGYIAVPVTSAATATVVAATAGAGSATVVNTTDVLTTVTSGWASGTTFTYQWYRGTTAISGATSIGYTPTSADRDTTLKVQVSGTAPGLNPVAVFSAAKNYTLTATGTPTITGTKTVGSVLTAVDGQTYTTVDGAPSTITRSYEWFRDGTAIASATASTYTLVTADVGKVITARLTSRATGYIASTATTAATTAITLPSKAPGAVTVGAANYTLSAVTTGWDSGTTFTYQWLREGDVIAGATSQTLAVTESDRGWWFGVRVIGTQPGYAPATVTTTNANYFADAYGQVAITGTASVGSTLTMTESVTYYTPTSPAGRSYQWYAGGVAISGATASTYVLAPADVNKYITVRFTASYTNLISYSVTSPSSGLVTPAAQTAGTATISNATDALTVVTAGWESGVTFSYQWYRGTTAISGATAQTYTPTSADRGSALKAEVTATKTGYAAATAFTPAKDYSLTATGSVTLTGTATNGSTLTIVDGQSYTTADGTKTVTKSYEWLRDGTAIASATASTYTLTSTDVGKVITAKVTSRATGYIALSTTSAGATIAAGTKAAGTVTVSNTTDALTAVPAGWDSGTTFTYQWFRGASAISGATAGTYTPTSADRGNALKVELTGTQPGYVAVAAFSSAKDYSLTATGSVTITGTASNGSTLTIADGQSYTTVDGAKTVTKTYEWLRDGTTIASATASTYTLTSTDIGKVITAKVTSRATGYIALTTTSAGTTAIVAGTQTAGTVTVSNATDALTAVPAGWDSGTTFTYQWFRGASAISGATAGTYTPTAADRGNALRVELTGTRPGYLAVTATSAAKDYSLTATGTVTLSGTASNGSTLTVVDGQSYATVDGTQSVTKTYEWLRDGTTIASATASTYTVTASDIGKVITAKVTSRATGYIALTTTSAGTAAIVAGTKAAGTVTVSNTTDALTAVPAGWDSGTTYTYQWYRGTSAISGATASTYTPTSADRGATIKLELTGTQPGYVAVAAFSSTKDYSLTATGSVTITGTASNGSTLTISDGQSYTTVDGAKTLTKTYEWLRDGTVIASATASTYTLVTADVGAVITARVTAKATGYIALTSTSAATSTVLVGTKAAGTVTISNTTNALTAVPAGWDSGTTYSYQWYRGTTAITDATSSTYTPTLADRDVALKVQVTGTQPGYVAVAAFSPAKDYSLNATGSVTLSGTTTVGSTLTVVDGQSYTTADGAKTPTVRSYAWYRDGTVIASATASTYSLVSADLGAVITARLTAAATGYIAWTKDSTATAAITLPSKAPGTVTISNATDALTAVLAGWDSGTTYTYRWLRGSTPISGATASSYTPTSADRGNTLKVEVTGTQPGYLAAVATSAAKDYSLTATGSVTITGTVTFGSTLTAADGQSYTTADGTKTVTRSYEWLRDGTPIASATASTYALTSTDIGAAMSVRVTTRATGYIATSATSAATAAVGLGTKAAGTVTISNATDELTAVPAGWDSGTTYTYKWFRGATAISGATASTYTPTSADRGNALKVEVTGAQPNYVAVAASSAAKDYSLTATGSVTLTGTAANGSTLTIADGQVYSTADGTKPISSRTYEWLRNGATIASATASTYALTATDIGAVITAKVTSRATGYIALTTTSTATAAVAPGTKAAGTVTISNATDALAAVVAGWDSGTTYTYQWFRGATAISGATSSSYTPTVSDRDAQLKVQVTGTQPGYVAVAASSAAKDYSLNATGTLTVSGSATVGSALALVQSLSYTTTDGAATVTGRSYQWYRNGTAIASATGSTYTLVTADLGAVITAKIVATATGYIAHTQSSTSTTAVTLPSKAPGSATISNATDVLTVVTSGWDSGTTFSYQWFRAGSAISGATSSSYTPGSSDRGSALTVEVTGTQPGYLPATATTAPKDYSLTATGAVTVSGTTANGSTLTIADGQVYTTADGTKPISSKTYAWFRDGTVIASATATTYTLTATDIGTRISARVTSHATGYISLTTASAASSVVDPGTKAAGAAAIDNTTNTLTIVTSGWDSGTTFEYTWFRGLTAISGATSSTYTPTADDRGFSLSATVVGTQPGYFAVARSTTAKDYSLTATGTVSLSGDATVGSTLTVEDNQSYTTADGSRPIAGRSYQWYRNGMVIPFAAASSYTLVTADLGTVITARLTSAATGYIALATLSTATAPVVPPTTGAGTATISNSTNVLTVETFDWAEGTTFTYQWYRGATAISGETTEFYTPTSGDRGVELKAKVTGTQPGSLAVSVFTPAKDYSLTATGSLSLSGDTTVGSWLFVLDEQDYTTADGAASLSERTFQWYRNGVALEGATDWSYQLSADDAGAVITARVTSSVTGYISVSKLSTPTATITLPVTPAGYVYVSNPGTALVADTYDWESDTEFAYQWYRGATPITGATAESYTPTQADRGAMLMVKLTGTRPGFLPTSVFSDPRDFSLYLQGDVTFLGDETVGNQLLLWYNLNYITADGPVWVGGETFAWYRNGVLIPGETLPYYTLAEADAGTVITATVTGSLTGYIPVTVTSVPTGAIKALAADPGYAAISNATDVLTVVTAGWNYGTTFSYQWFRGTDEIAGETTATYTPTAADRGFALKVRVTGAQPSYGESAVFTVARDFSLTATGAVVLYGDATVGSTLSANDEQSYAVEGYEVHPSTRSYTWQRDGETIANATDPYYILSADDIGSRITVSLTTRYTGYIAQESTSEATAVVAEEAPVDDEPGTASISNATDEFTVVTDGWDEGTTFAYRWQRYGSAIPGAVSATYTPTSADRGMQLSVRVIASQPGKAAVTVITESKDYSLNATGVVTVDGTGTVGESLSIVEALEYTTVDGPATPTARTYSWLRDGVLIDGATSDSYLLGVDDAGTVITATLTARLTGYIAVTATSGNAVTVEGGDPTVNLPGTASISNATDELVVITTGWDDGTTFAYQWFRGDAEISGATTEFYTPTSADRGIQLKVRVTGTEPGFDPAEVYTESKDFSITADGSLAISGSAIVGSTLTLSNELLYETADGVPTVRAREYQWFRNGVAIANATAASYPVVSADLGKTITATIVARATGYIAHSVTTAPTTTVVVSTFATAKVTKSGVVLTAVPEWTGNPISGTTYTYQWYRGTAAISKATKVSYSIASADLNKEIKVRIIAKRSGATAVTRVSTAANYTVTPLTKLPTFTGTIAIGQDLVLDTREYTNGGSTTAIQWLRSGKAIAGATGATYRLQALDKGKVISVKVTAGAPGFLSTSSASAATQKVDANAFGPVAEVTVSRTAVPLVLQADAGLGESATGAKLAYQWYRDGAAISKATKVTYTLTTADYNKRITVRVVATKATVTTMVRFSGAENFSVIATGTLTINNTKPARGNVLTVTPPQFSNGAAVSYQWYVGGKAVAGQTANTFTVPSTAKGKVVAVRVIAAANGYLSYVKSSANTAKVK
jgi:hypothetical protein